MPTGPSLQGEKAVKVRVERTGEFFESFASAYVIDRECAGHKPNGTLYAEGEIFRYLETPDGKNFSSGVAHRDVAAREQDVKHGPLLSLRLDVVAEQQILVAQVHLPIGDDRVGPCGLPAAVGLLEAPTLKVFLGAGFDQEHGTLLRAVIEPAVRKGK